MRKSIIVAASQNGVIGKDNSLPWRLPGDLRRFKALTIGHTLIMGRKTYESLPPKMRPLPGRTTVVLTRNSVGMFSFAADTLAGAIESASRIETNQGTREAPAEIFICGGGEVYSEAMEQRLIDRIYLTVVERDFEGDTFFGKPATATFVPLRGSFTRFSMRVDEFWNKTNSERGEGELPHRFETWDRVR